VQDAWHGQGYGRILLEARERGCKVILISSYSFQAPGFYQKCGLSWLSVKRFPALPSVLHAGQALRGAVMRLTNTTKARMGEMEERFSPLDC